MENNIFTLHITQFPLPPIALTYVHML